MLSGNLRPRGANLELPIGSSFGEPHAQVSVRRVTAGHLKDPVPPRGTESAQTLEHSSQHRMELCRVGNVTLPGTLGRDGQRQCPRLPREGAEVYALEEVVVASRRSGRPALRGPARSNGGSQPAQDACARAIGVYCYYRHTCLTYFMIPPHMGCRPRRDSLLSVAILPSCYQSAAKLWRARFRAVMDVIIKGSLRTLVGCAPLAS